MQPSEFGKLNMKIFKHSKSNIVRGFFYENYSLKMKKIFKFYRSKRER